jgi:glycolate oxidase iron-sulfur subunit
LFARLGETGRRIAAMLGLARTPSPASEFPATGAITPSTRAIARVAILQGCAQKVLRPQTNDATIRLLTRLGVESVLVAGEVCCGALLHHLGDEAVALQQVRRNVDVWTAEIEAKGLDAIIITASGCGTMIKDYGYLLRLDGDYADKAARVSALTKDITEFLSGLALPQPRNIENLSIAYHSACSMQHGQKIDALPKNLLARAGFEVRSIPEGHLCCGSAGTYNILQPELALALRDRKIGNILKTDPDCVATGNIGCITQIASGSDLPVMHSVELLDYAYGGPKPAELTRN